MLEPGIALDLSVSLNPGGVDGYAAYPPIEYTIIDWVPQAVDMLGLMRPAGALRDVLFPQFTVLTHRPFYLGLLCFLWQRLEERGKAAGKDVQSEFHPLEILWGTAVGLVERLLSVKKLTRLLELLPRAPALCHPSWLGLKGFR